MEKDHRFAVLIDADNVSSKYIKTILNEVSSEGAATYKRIYGDWTKPAMEHWKATLLENSILPVQQYSYTVGKNASDSALIIDAMDILYAGRVDGFAIVSSDSDFTRLAARLRESGMFVVGMGEHKTPKPFIKACSRFIFLDLINKDLARADKLEGVTEMTSLETISAALQAIVNDISEEDGWAFTGSVGSQLVSRYPDFDVRNFGFQKLTPFLDSLGLFEIKSIAANGRNNIHLYYIRLKSVYEDDSV